METILEYLSVTLRYEVQKYIQQNRKEIEEIRIRAKKPIVIKTSEMIEILEKHIVTTEEILETFQKVCENSIYSYKKQICEGYITIRGGHRVGIVGNCVLENGQVININYISSLNFRVAREKKGCSLELLKYVIDYKKSNIFNTLIVSLPGAGKTTMLRDIIRQLSNGIPAVKFKGRMCGVVDERGEIAAMYKGVPQNDVGVLTDVIDNVTKSLGMRMLVRSMAPEIIACDEIGTKEDIEAINYAICTGVKGIFTAHGNNIKDVIIHLGDLINKCIIEKIVFLDNVNKGTIREIYTLEKEEKKYVREL